MMTLPETRGARRGEGALNARKAPEVRRRFGFRASVAANVEFWRANSIPDLAEPTSAALFPPWAAGRRELN